MNPRKAGENRKCPDMAVGLEKRIYIREPKRTERKGDGVWSRTQPQRMPSSRKEAEKRGGNREEAEGSALGSILKKNYIVCSQAT